MIYYGLPAWQNRAWRCVAESNISFLFRNSAELEIHDIFVFSIITAKMLGGRSLSRAAMRGNLRSISLVKPVSPARSVCFMREIVSVEPEH